MVNFKVYFSKIFCLKKKICGYFDKKKLLIKEKKLGLYEVFWFLYIIVENSEKIFIRYFRKEKVR